jgi:hypothetical protein
VVYALKLNQEFRNRSDKSSICEVSQALKFIFPKQIIIKFDKNKRNLFFFLNETAQPILCNTKQKQTFSPII